MNSVSSNRASALPAVGLVVVPVVVVVVVPEVDGEVGSVVVEVVGAVVTVVDAVVDVVADGSVLLDVVLLGEVVLLFSLT